jgi:carboxyl-terminal processing protease
MRTDKQTTAEPTQGEPAGETRRPLLRRLVRNSVRVLVLLFVFIVGIGVGNGNIRFYHGSVANPNLPAKLDYGSVDEVYQQLRANYNGKLTEDQLLNGLKSGLTNATNDPYTEFFTAGEARTFSDQLNNSFSGVGAELGKNTSGDLIVVAPIRGFPAEKAGLKPKDIIAAIDGKSTGGLGIEEAVSKIRGKVGSQVRLDIIRGGKQLHFTITRQTITIPSVSFKVLAGNLGYIQIITFADDTSDLIRQAADKLKAEHVRGVILDLRDNPGGLLDAAVSVASKWLPEGTLLLQEKRGDVVTQTYNAEGDSPLRGLPTVVLVNGGSASAAEITAGALHDNKAAVLIGEKTYGKGVVQRLVPLSGGDELKVTVASWYRPNGQNINHKGIAPDKLVKLTGKDAAAGKDPQLDAAKAYLQR